MRRPFAYGVAPGGGLTLSEVEGNDITGGSVRQEGRILPVYWQNPALVTLSRAGG